MSESRKVPYDPALFESEQWRRFWIGKNPRVKKATREYLEKYRTLRAVSQWETAKKNNITEASIINNIKSLRQKKIIEDLKHTSVFGSRSTF